MEDFDLNIVASKSIKGIFALVSRTFFVQVLAIIANLVLTIYLDPSSFGIFFIVSSVMVFFAYFQDIGLAASLIQKKEEPTLRELRTAFTIQQILVLLIVLPGIIFSGKIADFYNMDSSGTFLLISFFLSFLLSSLRTIPTVMLERRLDFHKLVLPQIGENIVYNIALIVLAVSGFGVTSFTVAVFLRGVVGLILTYMVQPWQIGFAYDKEGLRRLVSFGLPFQANSILALFKDDLINVYVGKILPLQQVGYIGFAQKWAFLPLRLVLDNVIKIIFPSFSRLQHDEKALRIFIEKALYMISFFIFPISAGFITLSSYFIEFVPKYQKWEPALLSLSFFSLNAVIGSLTNPLTNFLNAIGKVRITLYFMVFWTALTWILTPILIRAYGFNGVSMASFIVAASSLSIIFVVRKYIEFSFLKPIYKQLIATVIMALFILVSKSIITSLHLLFVEIGVAACVYFVTMFMISGKEMIATYRLVKENIRK